MLPLVWRARQFHATVQRKPESIVVEPIIRDNQAPFFYISSASSDNFEAWSMEPIPWETKNDVQRLFRKALRKNLERLASSTENAPLAIRGVYWTREAQPCDTENRLFYNLQQQKWCTVRYAYPILSFERISKLPRLCPDLAVEKPNHYYAYHMASLRSDFEYSDRCGPALLAFEATYNSVSELNKSGSVWLGVCRGDFDVAGAKNLTTEECIHFGLRLTLLVPSAMGKNNKFSMKPIFDGVVSAMHQHDGSSQEEIVGQLSEGLKAPKEKIIQYLCSPEFKVLGQHRMISLHNGKVRFEPRDDMCEAGELRLEIMHSREIIALQGEVFQIRA